MKKQCHPDRTAIMTNLRNSGLIRNMIIVAALCICYLVGKHFQTVQNFPADAISKVNSVKTIDEH